MRALFIYLAFGLASASAVSGLRLTELGFWRDVGAWPLIALYRVVDLHILITQRMQDYLTLGFAVAFVIYAVSRLEARARADRALRDRGRRPAA